MSKDPQQTAFRSETVVRLAERYHLSITIRPDGRIIGLASEVRKLTLLLERWSKAKSKAQRSKKRRTERSSPGDRSKTWRPASTTEARSNADRPGRDSHPVR